MTRKIIPISFLMLISTVLIMMPSNSYGQGVVSQNQTTVIKAGNLWDGMADSALGPMEILVDNDIIIEVDKNVSKPAGAKIVDLSNYTVTPGLIDLHVHLGIPNPQREMSLTAASLVGTSPYFKLLSAASDVYKVMLSGFTTVREMGDPIPGYGMVDLRNLINNGVIPGSRLIVATHFATTTGGHGDITTILPKQFQEELKIEGQRIVGDDQAREFVREETSRGSDFIKIIAEGSYSEPGAGNNAKIQGFTNNELRAFLEEANRLHMPVAVHVHTPATTQFLIANNVSTIEHGSVLDFQTVSLLEQKGVPWVPTVNRYIQAANENQTWLDSLPPYAAEKNRESGPLMKNTQEILVAQLNNNRSNLIVGYGSDAGYDMPLANNNWREMDAMISIGFTPMQALKSATSDAAKIIGLPNIGAIEINKTADIVAWNGDITTEWKAIRDNVFVMKEGIIYKSPK